MRRAWILATALASTTVLQAQPGGVGLRPVLNNASVEVAQLLLLPGARENPHAHASPLLVVQIPGGTVEYVAPNTTHAAANTGTAPAQAVVVTLKPARTPGATAPGLPAPPGVTGRGLLNNADVAVSRVEFAPSAREPVHTHPYDLLAIVLRGAMVEVQIGGEKNTRGYAAGDVIFMPRDTPHAVANPAAETFAVIAMAIK